MATKLPIRFFYNGIPQVPQTTVSFYFAFYLFTALPTAKPHIISKVVVETKKNPCSMSRHIKYVVRTRSA